jgi:poly(3-hydroxybutyrate) depolymerase
MLDKVLEDFRADRNRVYLTGISLGAFGAFHMASGLSPLESLNAIVNKVSSDVQFLLSTS